MSSRLSLPSVGTAARGWGYTKCQALPQHQAGPQQQELEQMQQVTGPLERRQTGAALHPHWH
eukprot:scaffold172947_cov29-Prasinocladus_malaysianus.AAC.1